MKVCGYNGFGQLGEKMIPSFKLFGGHNTIPERDSQLDISSLISISFQYYQSIMITNDGKAYAYGFNCEGIINGLLPRKVYEKEEIILTDKKGHPFKFLSAVCCYQYTLYLVSGEDDDNNQIIFCYQERLPSKPRFLSINGRNPIKLFGGNKVSAAIDSLGGVTIFPKELYCMVQPFQPLNLPFGDKAVSVACCDKNILILGLSGRVYELSTKSSLTKCSLVRDFDGIKIVSISGYMEHFLVASDDGRAFSRGLNNWGQLGIGSQIDSSHFVEITSLNKYKITFVFAGVHHSLFLTSNGQVLACGTKFYENLFVPNDKSGMETIPVETTIKSGATFCIAASHQSAVFIGCEPPPNMPNIPVGRSKILTDINVKTGKTSTMNDSLIKKLQSENEQKNKLIKELQNKNEQQMELIQKLQKENQEHLFLINELTNENEEQTKLVNQLKHANKEKIKEISNLKKENNEKAVEVSI